MCDRLMGYWKIGNTCDEPSTWSDLNDLFDEYSSWLYENGWCIGIIYLIAGPLIALFGVTMFPYVVASLVAIFTLGFFCGLGFAFGWMETTGGTIAIILAGLVLGILAGCLVRRNFKWMLGLLGMIGGFFAGSLLFSLISGMAGGWNAVWGYWVFSSILAIVGCIAACYIGMPVVMVATSLAGSYLFMRSWTLFFPGNYPSESELVASKEEDVLEMSAMFWAYIGIFFVSFACSLTFQCKCAKPNQELDDHF